MDPYLFDPFLLTLNLSHIPSPYAFITFMSDALSLCPYAHLPLRNEETCRINMPKSVSLFCPSDPIPSRRLILKPERVLRLVLSSSPYFGIRQDGVALSTLLSTGCVIQS